MRNKPWHCNTASHRSICCFVTLTRLTLLKHSSFFLSNKINNEMVLFSVTVLWFFKINYLPKWNVINTIFLFTCWMPKSSRFSSVIQSCIECFVTSKKRRRCSHCAVRNSTIFDTNCAKCF